MFTSRQTHCYKVQLGSLQCCHNYLKKSRIGYGRAFLMIGFGSIQCLVPLILVAALLAVMSSISAGGEFFEPFNVTYDHRALIIGAKRRMLISAGVHYPRATPEMWPTIISKSREGGADVIQTYVFWNGHEPLRGQYYFEGRYDLVKFVRLVGSSGLYLHLRIGPYNYGAFIEKDGAGLRGPIKLAGFKRGVIDLSNFPWTYQVGLKGEFLKIFSASDQEKVAWTSLQPDKIQAAFTWYKAYFDAPEGNDTVALDLGSMGKGEAWVNGRGIGRYWSLIAPSHGCPRTCNYRGAYNERKCLTNCGKPTQTWYHIPREWLQASDNLLVLFEETGGNPLAIRLTKHATKTICAQVSETHCLPLSAWHRDEVGVISLQKSEPEMYLHCDDGHVISSITFASFGTPHGGCQRFSKGTCHARRSLSVVSEICLGRNECCIAVSMDRFSPDPCVGIVKKLAVQAECSPLPSFGLSVAAGVKKMMASS